MLRQASVGPSSAPGRGAGERPTDACRNIVPVLGVHIASYDNLRGISPSATMPTFKPIARLMKKARDAHSRHRDRHRPTNFGFAISDRVDYLDGNAWDRLTA